MQQAWSVYSCLLSMLINVYPLFRRGGWAPLHDFGKQQLGVLCGSFRWSRMGSLPYATILKGAEWFPSLAGAVRAASCAGVCEFTSVPDSTNLHLSPTGLLLTPLSRRKSDNSIFLFYMMQAVSADPANICLNLWCEIAHCQIRQVWGLFHLVMLTAWITLSIST